MQILIGVLVLIFFVILPIITMTIYNKTFGERCEERRYESYRVENFEGLEVEECTIIANKGQRLAGYKYSRQGQNPKALLVFVHGLCGGHWNYMDICNHFLKKDFAVFAYDATGNGQSEGKKVGGFAQGLADLDYVLNYVKELPEYKGLSIVLMGHSWGGFCVGNILNFHPDVKAVVAVSGFDTSACLL
ncbi:MAG: alpha/beta fold hydrolase, partial [Agathobacter sp.]|nr:alpha/beta fold hydrolase [Agathobacter sp.]